MDFEEWWNETEQYDNHGDPVKAAWDAGIQEGIERMQKAYQIRPRGKSILAHLPEGYVLVPVEPTEAMLNAGLDANVVPHPEDIYKAMIQASQEEV